MKRIDNHLIHADLELKKLNHFLPPCHPVMEKSGMHHGFSESEVNGQIHDFKWQSGTHYIYALQSQLCDTLTYILRSFINKASYKLVDK